MDQYSKGCQDPGRAHNRDKDIRSRDTICKGLHKDPRDNLHQVMRTTMVDRASRDPLCEESPFLEYEMWSSDGWERFATVEF